MAQWIVGTVAHSEVGVRSWVSPRAARVAPRAMRTWMATGSSPVTASVTVSSTYSRALAAMNANPASGPAWVASTRDSKVPRLR